MDRINKNEKKKIIIYGTGKLAQMIYYLLQESKDYEAVCFTADKQYCTNETFLNLPLILFDNIQEYYPPSEYRMLTVIGGLGGTKLRENMYQKAKQKGYQHINYIHPTTIIQGNIHMGENNIIFPNSIIGFSGKMGDNNMIREKVYLGHDFIVGSHCFMGVGCNIGGESNIGDLTYIAMDVTITNNIDIGQETFIGIGSLVLKSIRNVGGKHYGRPAKESLK